MKCDRLGGKRPAALTLEFEGRAEVDDIAQPMLLSEGEHVGRRECVQRIASKELAPAKRSPLMSGITPEIPEIHAAIEFDSSFHGGAF
jgi:hypothetical protein